jgi:hypothetical protein
VSTLNESAAYATDNDLVLPLTAAIVQAAISITYEDADTPSHGERKALAGRVLTNPGGMVAAFAWATSSNPTVVDKWTAGDQAGALGDMSYVLGTVWDAVAGA